MSNIATLPIAAMNSGDDLKIAVKNNNLNEINKLLSQGANSNARNIVGNLLHTVAQLNIGESHFEVAEILLKDGANVNAVDKYNRTPLWYLMRRGNARIVQLFIDFNADMNLSKFMTDNKIHLFFSVHGFYYVEVLQLLIDQGFDINYRDRYGKTPLHWSCDMKMGNIKLAKCLLKNGADINRVGKNPSLFSSALCAYRNFLNDASRDNVF